MFYFQQLLNTALAGIDGTAIISTVTNFAFAILLIGFLIGLYQAAFRGVNGSFNTVANFIGSTSVHRLRKRHTSTVTA